MKKGGYRQTGEEDHNHHTAQEAEQEHQEEEAQYIWEQIRKQKIYLWKQPEVWKPIIPEEEATSQANTTTQGEAQEAATHQATPYSC
eukprot:7227936-Prorocentrum_lima.AAC.1